MHITLRTFKITLELFEAPKGVKYQCKSDGFVNVCFPLRGKKKHLLQCMQ